MIGWGLAILVLIVAGLFIARSVMDVKSSKRPEVQHVDEEQPKTVATSGRDTKFIPDETKAKIEEVEKRVFDKADEAKKIADHESAIFPPELDGMADASEAPRERSPQEESAIMRSITKKVEEVRKLSEQG